ncbi:N-acetylmuramoyl-L-alanine amidase-like domain-containing protein [Prolixibacter sp. SD074]|uniref:N-acetylmuramoyl-L-alanine amidase-like domain-containing protein n=1 Tax=Prolixibacter sp. SD074 TaxID=2652391 RepID=UPI001274B333|nr:N-acetylmuramoyl-L-alanine amidase-like domain-containing protein [Prolixibacter sp. SD074]GET31037.1 xylanase [Prolixibacter sp. SD074]
MKWSIKYLLLLIILALPFGLKAASPKDSAAPGPDVIYSAQDKVILNRIFTDLLPKKDSSMGQIMVLVGKEFLGTPYVAHTLDNRDKEALIVNLRELDCTTYVENCLAIARTIKSGKPTFRKFTRELENVRYRNGKLDGYLSRLHYFSEWISNNEKKGLVEDVTYQIGGKPFPLDLDFMSNHPDDYPQLKKHPEWVPEMAQREKEISGNSFFYISKGKIEEAEPDIHDGDIFALTSAIKGIDIMHVGIMLKENGRVHMMHASSKAMKVIIGEVTMEDYLNGRKNVSGMMDIRPLPPKD